MLLKCVRSVLCMIFAGMLCAASAAVVDTIKGVVSDSINGMLIDSVTVAAEGATTLSDTAGVFTLVIPSTTVVPFVAPRNMPALKWNSENGLFSWNGYSAEVSIKVFSLQGNIVARTVSGKNRGGSTFSIAPLPQGIYMVAIETQGQQSVYKISSVKTRQLHSFSLLSPNPNSLSKASAAATASDHVVTFIKNNFDTLKISVLAGTTKSIAAKMKSPYPLRNVFKLFTVPGIPDPGARAAETRAQQESAPGNRLRHGHGGKIQCSLP